MFLKRVKSIPWFISDYLSFEKLNQSDKRFELSVQNLKPIFIDKTSTTLFEPHYVYHPAWAARIVAKTKPAKHIDISSMLQFSTIVSAFVPVEFYDYRPAHLNLTGYKSEHGDLTKLHFPTDSVESLSCMHTLEHIGLGRYGDPINPKGDIAAALELARVLKPGGSFIFVTPVGKPTLEFNAHRIYSYEQVLDLFPTLMNARKDSHEVFISRFSSLAKLCIGISVISAILLFILAPFAVSLLFGEAYYQSVILTKIYAWVSIGTISILLIQQYLIAENKTMWFLGISVGGAVINVILNTLMIPALGLFGAAYATLVTLILMVIFFISVKKLKYI